ncbi:PRC-barrel domain-containing protein [Candidatus Raskinella chloraquaticus]|jgi:sporulation protein YlmC with PRC-barrel domain|uniref:PRC-barrel domain-containing protein n=1 Tax=Candidatus Raskinella chloraquaticus TaxID=1951219 RepID=A0A1W9HXT0_9HYPH|nr:MAG: hypothetical protein A4S15_08555 [Proteobacteria bacterium SG_bin8]
MRYLKSSVLILALAAASAAFAAGTLPVIPTDSVTVTMYYKQTVYDQADKKLGDVDDVLINRSGQITGFIVGVGGFVGVGEKDVAVPFSAISVTTKDGKHYLSMTESKESLTSAVGYKYDRNLMTWVAAK